MNAFGAAARVGDACESDLLAEASAALGRDDARLARHLYARALDQACDAASRAEALEGLGRAAHRSGRPREAARLLEEALAVGNSRAYERPDLAEALGRSYAELGELERSHGVFEECERKFRSDGDVANQIRFACLLAYSLTDLGRFEEAAAVVRAATAAGAGTADPRTRALLCWAEARLRGEQGQTELAAQHAERALAILRETNHHHFLAQTYELLASLYLDLGRADEALSLLRSGWPLLITNATPLEVAHYRIEEARALAATGEREGAAAVAMRVAAQLDGTHPGDAGRAYVLLAEIFSDLGDVPRARELYESAITLLRRQGPNRYLAAAYRRLGELFEREYRTGDAIAVLGRALAIQERLDRSVAESTFPA